MKRGEHSRAASRLQLYRASAIGKHSRSTAVGLYWGEEKARIQEPEKSWRSPQSQ